MNGPLTETELSAAAFWGYRGDIFRRGCALQQQADETL